MTPNNPYAVLKSIELAIKSISKDIRKSHGGADKINRLASLVNAYTKLADLFAVEEKPFNAYDAMVAQDLARIAKRKESRM